MPVPWPELADPASDALVTSCDGAAELPFDVEPGVPSDAPILWTRLDLLPAPPATACVWLYSSAAQTASRAQHSAHPSPEEPP